MADGHEILLGINKVLQLGVFFGLFFGLFSRFFFGFGLVGDGVYVGRI